MTHQTASVQLGSLFCHLLEEMENVGISSMNSLTNLLFRKFQVLSWSSFQLPYIKSTNHAKTTRADHVWQLFLSSAVTLGTFGCWRPWRLAPDEPGLIVITQSGAGCPLRSASVHHGVELWPALWLRRPSPVALVVLVVLGAEWQKTVPYGARKIGQK